MNIKFSRFTLTPKKKLNRLTPVSPMDGVYLSSQMNGETAFVEYFPHVALGDQNVEEFLETFREQKTEYQQKVFQLLQKDTNYQHYPAKKFKNHELWSGGKISAPVIKYKLQHSDDETFHEALKIGVRVRLDANGGFTPEAVQKLISLPQEWKNLIEYVEDPFTETDWKDFPFPRARDWVAGNPFEYYIYKPACERLPDSSQLVFSSYLGSSLSDWHAYCELLEHGDFSGVHGIVTPGHYEEVENIYLGDYQNGFLPDLSLIQGMYQKLATREWRSLCSM